jgi:hypothetical protein
MVVSTSNERRMTFLERSRIAYPANEGQSQTRQTEIVDDGPLT